MTNFQVLATILLSSQFSPQLPTSVYLLPSISPCLIPPQGGKKVLFLSHTEQFCFLLQKHLTSFFAETQRLICTKDACPGIFQTNEAQCHKRNLLKIIYKVMKKCFRKISPVTAQYSVTLRYHNVLAAPKFNYSI